MCSWQEPEKGIGELVFSVVKWFLVQFTELQSAAVASLIDAGAYM